METKKTVKSYSPEVKERAVRMVLEHLSEHASQWAAICSIAAKIGCSGETLRHWVRRHEREAGLRDGMTSEVRDRLKALDVAGLPANLGRSFATFYVAAALLAAATLLTALRKPNTLLRGFLQPAPASE